MSPLYALPAHIRKCRTTVLLSLFATLGLLLAAGITLRAQTRQPLSASKPNSEPLRLRPGKAVTDRLSGGQSRSYLIRVKAGQFIHVDVEQQGIYVTLAVFDSSNKKLAGMDSLNGAWGPEALSIIAAESGTIRLEINAGYPDAATGQYEARLTDLHPATPADRTRLSAERTYSEGLALYRKGDPDSKKAATSNWRQSFDLWRAIGDQAGEAITIRSIGVARHELGDSQGALDSEAQALVLYRALKDRGGEARTLNSMGLAHKDLGEPQKALDDFNQALPLRRAVGDRDGEAATLNDIGIVYSDLGEKQKALDYYTQALPVYRAVGDHGGEAATLSNMGSAYSDLGEKQQALDYYTQALPPYRAAGDRDAEAWNLFDIGIAYDDLGESGKALDFYAQALPLFKAVQDAEGESVVLHLLMEHQKTPNPGFSTL